MSKKLEQSEYFEYPISWEEEFRCRRMVEEWRRFPDQFPTPGLRRPGTLQFFAQYTLMYLLRRDYRIRSLTWMTLASVDDQTRARVASGDYTIPASTKPCSKNSPKHDRREERRKKWQTMRLHMGPTFDTLQCAIVRAGFSGNDGEPDLFCYKDDGTWFFAEAKTVGEPLGPLQKKYFKILENLTGARKCRIYLCRVVQEGYARPALEAQHTERWARMMGT